MINVCTCSWRLFGCSLSEQREVGGGLFVCLCVDVLVCVSERVPENAYLCLCSENTQFSSPEEKEDLNIT